MADYIRLCTHCNNTTPHQLIVDGGVEKPFDEYEKNGKKEIIRERFTYFFLKCSTCGDYSLLGGFNFVNSEKPLTEFPTLFPNSGELDFSVPQNIRRVYDEASQIKNRAPNAFAGQIRRALEYLCKNKGATGGTLVKQLNSLVELNIIPPTLAEMTTLIRLLGNLGVHAQAEDVSTSEAQLLDEFFRTIIEYVYIAPAKIDNLRRNLERRKLRGEFGVFYDELISLLSTHDPIGIIFESNKDEYEAEVTTILPRLKECLSVDEVATVVHQEFVRWFDHGMSIEDGTGVTDSNIAGPKENYMKIADEIWKLWKTYNEATK